MKRITTTILAAVLITAMTSCEKEYKCYCKVTDPDTGKVLSTFTETATLTKSDAKTWCKGNEGASASWATVKCDLK